MSGPVIVVQSARKARRCDVCGKTIPIGSSYARLNKIGKPRMVWHLPEPCPESEGRES